MSRQVQLRRGTAVQHQTFTGLVGELTMNTTNNTLRLHDNVTNGGIEMLKSDMSNVLITSNGTFSLLDNLGQVSVRITNVADPVDDQDVATKAWVLANGGGGNTGNFTFTNGDITNTVDNYISIIATDYSQLESNASFIWVDTDGGHIETLGGEWLFDNNGDLILPAGGDIKDSLGNSLLVSQLDDLSDVTISPLILTQGQTLKYNGFGQFVNAKLNIEELDNIDIDGILDGQTLIWDDANTKFIASNVYTDTDAINAVGQNLVDNNLSHNDITFTLDNDNITASVSVALNNIAGVTITNPVEIYEVLKYNGGGAFINAQLSSSDLSDGSSLSPKLVVEVKDANYTSESNKLYLNDDVDNLIVTLHNTAEIGDVFYVQVNHAFSSTTIDTTFASVLYKGVIYSNPNDVVLSPNTTGLYQFRYLNDGIDSYWYITALGSSLHTLNNVDIDAITDGQTIVWDALNNKFIPHDLDGQAIQEEVDAIETSLGGYIDVNGEWVQPNGTNYIDGTTDFSDALSTLDSALNTLSGAVDAINPANFFQIANLFNEILGDVASQNTAKVNLGLVDDQGRFIESIDYGSVTDGLIGSSIDFQDANGTGETPLNAEDLFISTVYYSFEDYGCLIG